MRHSPESPSSSGASPDRDLVGRQHLKEMRRERRDSRGGGETTQEEAGQLPAHPVSRGLTRAERIARNRAETVLVRDESLITPLEDGGAKQVPGTNEKTLLSEGASREDPLAQADAFFENYLNKRGKDLDEGDRWIRETRESVIGAADIKEFEKRKCLDKLTRLQSVLGYLRRRGNQPTSEPQRMKAKRALKYLSDAGAIVLSARFTDEQSERFLAMLREKGLDTTTGEQKEPKISAEQPDTGTTRDSSKESSFSTPPTPEAPAPANLPIEPDQISELPLVAESPLARLLIFRTPEPIAPYANVPPPTPQMPGRPPSAHSDRTPGRDRRPRRTRIDIAPQSGILRGNTNNSPKNTPLMSQESPFKAYAAKKDTVEKKRAEETDLRPTLADILAKESKQFGDMLESYGDPETSELAKRMLSKNLNSEDTQHLAELRKEYLSRKEAGERLNEGMTDEYIDELALYSDEFDNLRSIIGVEALRNIIRSGITDKAIADPDKFRELVVRHEKLIAIEKQAEPANDAIKKICKKYDLSSPRVIVEAMAIEDRGEREIALRSALRSEMGIFKKLFERGSKKAARETADHADSFDELRRQRMWVMENSGRFIAELVSDDPEMRHSLTRALYKERIDIKREPALALEKVSSSVPTEEAVQGEWGAYKEANNWAGLTEEDAKNAARADFEAKYKKKHFPVQQSFWTRILGIFGEDLFGDRLQ